MERKGILHNKIEGKRFLIINKKEIKQFFFNAHYKLKFLEISWQKSYFLYL